MRKWAFQESTAISRMLGAKTCSVTIYLMEEMKTKKMFHFSMCYRLENNFLSEIRSSSRKMQAKSRTHPELSAYHKVYDGIQTHS